MNVTQWKRMICRLPLDAKYWEPKRRQQPTRKKKMIRVWCVSHTLNASVFCCEILDFYATFRDNNFLGVRVSFRGEQKQNDDDDKNDTKQFENLTRSTFKMWDGRKSKKRVCCDVDSCVWRFYQDKHIHSPEIVILLLTWEMTSSHTWNIINPDIP